MSDTTKASDGNHVNHYCCLPDCNKWGSFGFGENKIGLDPSVQGASESMRNRIDYIVIAVAAGGAFVALVGAIAQLLGWKP